MNDLPKHSNSTSSFISGLLTFVDDWINKKKSVDPIPIIQKLAIEKVANNPFKNLPTCDVAGQDTVQPFQTEIVDPKTPSESIVIVSGTSTLGEGQSKGKGRLCQNRTDRFFEGFSK
jgi:hypothetical protein